MAEFIFGFQQQLKMSHGIALSFDFRQVLLNEIPNASDVKQANFLDDKKGTDWWVERYNNKPLSIDLKAREKDFRKDDLALETWSVVEMRIIGWTRDASKASDYILWFWNDTRRWCLVPFPMLCRVFNLLWHEWSENFRMARQITNMNGSIYHSECVFVPRKIVWESIISHYKGGF